MNGAYPTTTRTDWRYLWAEYGLDGLIALHRGLGWFDGLDDTAAGEELVHWSLRAGYDPVSGQFGFYNRRTGHFIPDLDVEAPAPRASRATHVELRPIKQEPEPSPGAGVTIQFGHGLDRLYGTGA